MNVCLPIAPQVGAEKAAPGAPRELSAEYVAQFYTDTVIGPAPGQGEPAQAPRRCADRVLAARARAQAQAEAGGGRQLGVEPTVGLGAAMLIFLLVGAFAAGIAHAFQQVRERRILQVHQLHSSSASFDPRRSASTSTMTPTTWTQPSTPGARSASA